MSGFVRILSFVLAPLIIIPVAKARDRVSHPIRIALIGDSTVASYSSPPPDRPDLTGWGQVLGEFFDVHIEVHNFALSGRSSKSFLKEGHWAKVLAIKPDYVFIQFGHNDEPGKGERTTDPAGDYRDYLRQYIDEARGAGAVPVLVTPVARRTFESGKIVTSLTPYAEAMKLVGRETQTPVIDLLAASMAAFGRAGDEGGVDLSAAPTDRSHFSRKGARLVAGLVANALPRAVPALLARLKHDALLAAADGSEELPGIVRLALPPFVHAIVGQEANIYFDNVVLTLNPANYAFDVDCSKGRQQQERWTFTPQPDDVGEHELRVQIRNEQNQLVARGKCTVRVSPANAGQAKEVSLLLVGDSLTHASVYPERVLALAERTAGPQVSLVGSHGPNGTPGKVRHEGYGGWTAQRFATHYAATAREGDYRQRGSPFLYAGADGKAQLDFAAYCRDVNGGKSPDFVTIFLGPNDIFSFNDETIESGISTMLSHYDRLIEMAQSTAPQTQIGVMLPVPPAASQDAFGANYSNGQTRSQYRRNQHRLVERMIDHYSGREQERIDLVPVYVNLDCRHNYPTEAASVNADNPDQAVRQNNGVHPAASGYNQIGDALFAWLKCRSENGQPPAK